LIISSRKSSQDLSQWMIEWQGFIWFFSSPKYYSQLPDWSMCDLGMINCGSIYGYWWTSFIQYSLGICIWRIRISVNCPPSSDLTCEIELVGKLQTRDSVR
jgi:hypothetical protein